MMHLDELIWVLGVSLFVFQVLAETSGGGFEKQVGGECSKAATGFEMIKYSEKQNSFVSLFGTCKSKSAHCNSKSTALYTSTDIIKCEFSPVCVCVCLVVYGLCSFWFLRIASSRLAADRESPKLESWQSDPRRIFGIIIIVITIINVNTIIIVTTIINVATTIGSLCSWGVGKGSRDYWNPLAPQDLFSTCCQVITNFAANKNVLKKDEKVQSWVGTFLKDLWLSEGNVTPFLYNRQLLFLKERKKMLEYQIIEVCHYIILHSKFRYLLIQPMQ